MHIVQCSTLKSNAFEIDPEFVVLIHPNGINSVSYCWLDKSFRNYRNIRLSYVHYIIIAQLSKMNFQFSISTCTCNGTSKKDDDDVDASAVTAVVNQRFSWAATLSKGKNFFRHTSFLSIKNGEGEERDASVSRWSTYSEWHYGFPPCQWNGYLLFDWDVSNLGRCYDSFFVIVIITFSLSLAFLVPLTSWNIKTRNEQIKYTKIWTPVTQSD